MLTAVKKNEKEVKEEMERVLTEAVLNAPPPAAAVAQPSSTASDIQQAIAGLNLGAEIQQAFAGLNLRPASSEAAPRTGPEHVAKLSLRYTHIDEDAADFQKILGAVKLASEMTDSEIIYFMRKSENWN